MRLYCNYQKISVNPSWCSEKSTYRKIVDSHNVNTFMSKLDRKRKILLVPQHIRIIFDLCMFDVTSNDVTINTKITEFYIIHDTISCAPLSLINIISYNSNIFIFAIKFALLRQWIFQYETIRFIYL